MAGSFYRYHGETKWLASSGNAAIAIVNKTGSGKKITIRSFEIYNNTVLGNPLTDSNLETTRIKVDRVAATKIGVGDEVPMAAFDTDAGTWPSTVKVYKLVGVDPNYVTVAALTAVSVTAGVANYVPQTASFSLANEHSMARRRLSVRSGPLAGTYWISANSTAALSVYPAWSLSSSNITGYIEESETFASMGMFKTFSPSFGFFKSGGALTGRGERTATVWGDPHTAETQNIIVREGEGLAVFSSMPISTQPLFVEVVAILEGTPNRTYTSSYFTSLTGENTAIFAMRNNTGSGKTVLIRSIQVTETGGTDTPYMQLVPISAVDATTIDDSDKKLTVIKTDTITTDLSSNTCEIFTNTPVMPYQGIPFVYMAEGSAGNPKYVNYLQTKDYLGPVYATYFPENLAAKMDTAAAAYMSGSFAATMSWNRLRPGTLSETQGYVLREGEGIALVSAAETASGLTAAMNISSWMSFEIGLVLQVETSFNPTLTLTKLRANTEVRIHIKTTGVELDGIETVVTPDEIVGGVQYYKFSYQYDAGTYSGTVVNIMIISLDYVNQKIEYTLGSSDVTIPVSQQLDRTYNNP